MKKNTRYIVLLAGTAMLFVLVHLLSPRQLNWNPTFASNDKNPLGSYLINEMMDDIFPGQPVHNNNLTIYELGDTLEGDENIIAFATVLRMDNEDTKALLNKVNAGTDAFLSASYFQGLLADTLNLQTEDVMFGLNLFDAEQLADSSYLYLTEAKERTRYHYKMSDIYTYIKDVDSIKKKVTVIAYNEFKFPVTVVIQWGQGKLILNTTPHAFTNHYLLANNDAFISKTISHLNVRPVWWTEYYQLGRLESSSPLRAILRNEALTWAYYTLIFSLVLFIIFEAKRKQRIIPIIKPLQNTTLEFVKTIGNMYIQSGNHKGIAEKKIAYFMDHVRTTYFLYHESQEAFNEKLARKSGNTLEETQALLSLIKVIQQSPAISVQMLLDLNKRIESFMYPSPKK